jgi:hypothetical protein
MQVPIMLRSEYCNLYQPPPPEPDPEDDEDTLARKAEERANWQPIDLEGLGEDPMDEV